MSLPGDSYDIDRALRRLVRRVRWLGWGTVAAALLCAGLAWAATAHGLFLASHPLQPTVTHLDLPAPALYVGGGMSRTFTATERGLALMGTLIAFATFLLRRVVDGPRRTVVLVCGSALVGLVLLAQWTTGGDQRANPEMERLAAAKRYNRLLNHLKDRPPIPYGDYIAAQALVLSGEGARLKADHGAWLLRWSETAARKGYLGNRSPPRGAQVWEGSHASAQTMRALEIVAFGNTPTPFSNVYRFEVQQRMEASRLWLIALAPAGLLATLALVGLALSWRRGRRNLRQAEQWILQFDLYPDAEAAADAAVAELRPREVAADSPRTLPPIEFPQHEPVVAAPATR